MNFLLSQLSIVFGDRFVTVVFRVVLFVLGAIGGWMTDLELTIGNMGTERVVIELVLYGLFSILFALFVAATLYKRLLFRSVSTTQSGLGGLGGLFGVLVAGCPACSITIASYLGLASVMSLLPWHGLELKVLGVVLVARALIHTLRGLMVCERKIVINTAFRKQLFFGRFTIWEQRIIWSSIVLAAVVCVWSIGHYLSVGCQQNDTGYLVESTTHVVRCGLATELFPSS